MWLLTRWPDSGLVWFLASSKCTTYPVFPMIRNVKTFWLCRHQGAYVQKKGYMEQVLMDKLLVHLLTCYILSAYQCLFCRAGTRAIMFKHKDI
jgi:hypothetical protein